MAMCGVHLLCAGHAVNLCAYPKGGCACEAGQASSAEGKADAAQRRQDVTEEDGQGGIHQEMGVNDLASKWIEYTLCNVAKLSNFCLSEE